MPSTRPEDLVSRVPLLMAVLIGMGSASTIAVGLRFFARVRVSCSVGSDDWMMLVALVFSIVTSITGSIAAHYGMGRHIAALDSYQIINGIKMVWFARMGSQTAFGFVKLSIALLYLRIFSISRIFTNFLYATIGFNFVVTVIWLVMTIQCIPVSANWDRSEIATAKCIKYSVTVDYAFFAGVSHSLLDVTYVVLPLIFVWNLQLPFNTKIAITILLSLGLFAAVCSMIKISKTSQLGKTSDITWEFTDLSIWNVVELNVGIVVGSVPPMRPLLKLVYHNASDALGISSGSRSRSRQTKTAEIPATARPRKLSHKDSSTFELVDRQGETASGTKSDLERDASEESIVQQGKGIFRTREVQVSAVHDPNRHKSNANTVEFGESPYKNQARY